MTLGIPFVAGDLRLKVVPFGRAGEAPTWKRYSLDHRTTLATSAKPIEVNEPYDDGNLLGHRQAVLTEVVSSGQDLLTNRSTGRAAGRDMSMAEATEREILRRSG